MTQTTLGVLSILATLAGLVIGAIQLAKGQAREQARERREEAERAAAAAREPLLRELEEERREHTRCQGEIDKHAANMRAVQDRHAARVLALEGQIRQLEAELRRRSE